MQAFWKLFSENYWLLILTAVMIAAVYLWLRFLSQARQQAVEQMALLFRTDLTTYMERLKNNRRLGFIFRKSTILLYLLDGYLAQGDGPNAEAVITRLDQMRLEGQERVEFYQKRLSFYSSVQNAEEAKKSFRLLEDYLIKTKAAQMEKYRELLDEAEQILKIYIEHDTRLIEPLIQKAAATKNDVVRGITQYRIAKLAYFKGDTDLVNRYLRRAGTNVAGTYYGAIVDEAMADNTVLERK